jgi:hypothetical protein
MGLALFEKEGVEVKGVLANKLIPEKRERTLDYLKRALADEAMTVIGGRRTLILSRSLSGNTDTRRSL